MGHSFNKEILSPVCSPCIKLIIGFLLIISTRNVMAINCYNCNSLMDDTCMEIGKYAPLETTHLQKKCTLEDFAHNHIQPSTEEEIFCQIVKLRIHNGKHERTIRKCAFMPTVPKRHDNTFHERTVYDCFEDLCNRTERTSPSNWFLLSLLMILNKCVTF